MMISVGNIGVVGAAVRRRGGGVSTYDLTTAGDGPAIIGPISLRRLSRVGGSAMPVWLFDHPVSGSGDRLFAQTMSDGDVVNFSPALQFINGLYLDVPATSGAELVANGDFASDVANWAAQISGASIDWVDGRLRLTAGASGGRATQTISGLTAGQTYQFSGEIVSVSGTPGPTSAGRLTTSTDGSTTGQVFASSPVEVGGSGAWSTTFVPAGTSITAAIAVGPNAVVLADNISLRLAGASDGSFELRVSE